MNKKIILALTVIFTINMSNAIVTTSDENLKFRYENKIENVIGHIIYSLDNQQPFSQTQVLYLCRDSFKKPKLVPFGALKDIEIDVLKKINWNKWVYTSLYDIQPTESENNKYRLIGAIILGTTNPNVVTHLFEWSLKATQKSKL